MKKIAILHPRFREGGAENVSLKIIEELVNYFNITLIYNGKKIEIKKMNFLLGTSFSSNSFKTIYIPGGVLREVISARLVEKYFKKNSKNYDIVFSTSSDMDFGRKGIQYIHYPRFAKDDNLSLIKKIYRTFCNTISPYSEERMKKNITLANSYWTAKEIKKAYGIESIVIYPPVKDDFSVIPWEDKENAFICAGRIDPGKNIERNIEIIKEVRKKFPGIKLYIAGILGEKAYYNRIKRLAENNFEWVLLKENLSKKEFYKLLSRVKYGIHGMDEEHFGIVVAEMVKAGVVPFVPNGGGQVEIVKENQNLVYNSKEEAVEKIINILESSSFLQKNLQEELKEHGKNFSEKKFKEEIKKVVEGFIKNKPYY